MYPTLGALTLIFAFEAVIIGGLGSLWGTLLGGMVLGITQVVVSQVSVPYAILASQCCSWWCWRCARRACSATRRSWAEGEIRWHP